MFTTVIFPAVFLLIQGTAVYNHVHLTELLVSNNWEQRLEAYCFSKKAEWSLRITAPEFLMNVIKRNHFVPRKTKADNDFDAQITPRNVAIAILADWALPEATSIFIENIVVEANGLPNPPGVSSRAGMVLETTRPMLALIALGKQVAQPIVKELATIDPGYHLSNSEQNCIKARRTSLLIVLYKVVGYREAHQLLQDAAKQIQFRDRFAYANLINAANTVKAWER